jgi:hypothetical protein
MFGTISKHTDIHGAQARRRKNRREVWQAGCWEEDLVGPRGL